MSVISSLALITAIILVLSTKGRMGKREQVLKDFADKINGKLTRSFWNFSHNLEVVAEGQHVVFESYSRSRDFGTFDTSTLYGSAVQNHLFVHSSYNLQRSFELQLTPKKQAGMQIILQSTKGSQMLMGHDVLDARFSMTTTDEAFAKSILLDEKILPLVLSTITDQTNFYIGPKRNRFGKASSTEGMIALHETEVPLTVERLEQLRDIVVAVAKKL